MTLIASDISIQRAALDAAGTSLPGTYPALWAEPWPCPGTSLP